MDVEILYTNVPVVETILLAADKLYASEKQPPIDKDNFIRLLSLAVTNEHFMANGRWYKQCDGVSMGSALAVILANLWLSQYEGVLSGAGTTLSVSNARSSSDKSVCMSCQNKVTKRGYSIRCNVCLIWCHRKCTDLKVDDMRWYSRNKTPWYCGCHSNSAQVQVCIPKAKVLTGMPTTLLEQRE